MSTEVIVDEEFSFAPAAGEYTFSAKLFDRGSMYGINDGRVSKLWIGKGKTTAAHYDRGWDIKPGKEYKEVFDAVMKFLESAPKRFT